MTLEHDDAVRVASAARTAAAEAGQTGAVAVVDAYGDDLVVLRDHSASWFTAAAARAKARTSARFGRPCVELTGLAETWPEVFDIASDELAWRPVTLDGGVPIRRGGVVVGAVGVSGGPPEIDRRCADAAVASLEES
ncbi:heme-binding protein [Nocardioides sp. Kera G14]|uniref:heme-binding protein n=1 Tax=Nocardioides sp. Kera G14 TaxID=2884264 RepID=UPI001D115DFA|nr:heme-binding protein [Nocardioides sp. Kera G14]UDY24583.1 heme-binding protein [Nocardioides sp. Kera G14]